MAQDAVVNIIRGIGFMAGVLQRQQNEYLCGNCRGYYKTVKLMRERLGAVEGSIDHATLPEGIARLLNDAREILKALMTPADPVPQRKLGNCRFPEGKCYIKHARKFYEIMDPDAHVEKIEGQKGGH